MSNSVVPAHFGIGNAETVDSLEVQRPSGRIQRLEDIPVNQELTIVEPTGT